MMLHKAALLSYHHNLIKNIVCCHICTASVALSKSSRRLTRKFLLQSEGKKRTWHDSRVMTNPSNFVKPQGKGVKNMPRIRTLNKVFLDKITEIMSTGEVFAQLSGLSLEVSKVRVLPDLQGINVHWLCPGTDADDKIEHVLHNNSRAIRHELSQLRVLGHVPPITFVKDHRFKKLQEVERLLSVADFGEDFGTSNPGDHLKSSLLLSTTLDNNIKETINNGEVESDDPFSELFKISLSDLLSSDELEKDALPPELPPMRYEVLGVDTKKIYTKILQRLKQTQAEHRKNIEKQACRSSSQWSSDPCSISSRPQEIHRWAGKYKLLCKKESHRKNQNESILSIPPNYFVENEEEPEYIEEEDYMEEFDLHNEYDITLKP